MWDECWLMVLQLDNDVEEVIRAIGDVIKTVRPGGRIPWSDRIVLGCWAVCY